MVEIKPDEEQPPANGILVLLMRAVINTSLRTRLGVLTWQEISATLPKPLRHFLDEKYGI